MRRFRGGSRPASRKSVLPPALQEIGAESQLRFSIIIADPGQADRSRDVLAKRMANELTIQGGGRQLDVASAFQPGSAAVLRPLNVLNRAGIAVASVEVFGLVTEISDDALREVVHDWAVRGNTGPYRRRVERLAGPLLLDRCLAAAEAAERIREADAAAWRFAVGCVAFNTPGAEARLLDEAVSSDERGATALVNAAYDRVQLARLAGLTIDVPPGSILAALGRRGYVAERAAQLASLLPAPLDDVVTEGLRDLADRGDEAAPAALTALRAAAPTRRVRATCDAALDSGNANIRGAALALLARHWPDDARPVWREFLASTSGPLRWTAEAVISEYGTTEDLPDAAAHLATLIRARQAISMSPPRGSSLVNLLIRHREHPVAGVALDDLTARWSRLSDDMRSWLAEQHPWLVPAAVATNDEQSDAVPDELLTWPPPSVERDGSSFLLIFDEDGAHHPVRGRFEELAEHHPSVEVLDGDREWLSVAIATAQPDALVRELWSAASDGDQP